MKVVIEKEARKGLARMQRTARDAMMERLFAIADNPLAHHANVDRMKGRAQSFRLRQGDWRAIYELDATSNQMRVRIVDTRGSAYR
jgi:mRNA-degrading endonuclease RelE of RelBE toxin-antitoxin system